MESHIIKKKNTPTIGGIVLTSTIILSTLLFCNIKNYYVMVILFLIFSFSIIGLVDDIIKVVYNNTNGFRGSIKLVLQIIVSGVVLLFLIANNSGALDYDYTYLPFFKTSIYLGLLLVPFLIAVIVGSANAVNLTDGLDGLVSIPIIISTAVFGILSILTSLNNHYLPIINTDNISDIAIICASVIGTALAYFYYNGNSAKIFMGDCGSLMYGSFLGIVAVLLRYEVFYAIMGLLFVLEALSSILQVISYKLFKKRIFKMAPLHHHFEKLGFSEKQVVLSFWGFFIVCTIVAILGIINF